MKPNIGAGGGDMEDDDCGVSAFDLYNRSCLNEKGVGLARVF